MVAAIWWQWYWGGYPYNPNTRGAVILLRVAPMTAHYNDFIILIKYYRILHILLMPHFHLCFFTLFNLFLQFLVSEVHHHLNRLYGWINHRWMSRLWYHLSFKRRHRFMFEVCQAFITQPYHIGIRSNLSMSLSLLLPTWLQHFF